MSAPSPLHLFEGYGVELEYMIVDCETLNVAPIADSVLINAAGETEAEMDMGTLSWSNELVLHVIELKTNGPASRLSGLAPRFQEHVRRVNQILKRRNARLMPTSMHPWFNPAAETRIWPHEYSEVYRAFDRIFHCQGHGWSNLQSLHLNFPFCGDNEFVRLHTAIRALLPILPALAASSPLVEERVTGVMDNRMAYYRANSARVPSVTGWLIPEAVGSIQEYHDRILKPMYRDIAPSDPAGILRHEWLNARGAIARFERGSIEIRTLDIQEHPAADLAIATLIAEVLKRMVEERWATMAYQQSLRIDELHFLFMQTVSHGGDAVIDSPDYLRLFHLPNDRPITAAKMWERLYRIVYAESDLDIQAELAPLEIILRDGTLALRIIRGLKEKITRGLLQEMYANLCDCLEEGRPYLA